MLALAPRGHILGVLVVRHETRVHGDIVYFCFLFYVMRLNFELATISDFQITMVYRLWLMVYGYGLCHMAYDLSFIISESMITI